MQANKGRREWEGKKQKCLLARELLVDVCGMGWPLRRFLSHWAHSSTTFPFCCGNEMWPRGCVLENTVWAEVVCAPCRPGTLTLARQNSPRLFPSSWPGWRQRGVWPWEPLPEYGGVIGGRNLSPCRTTWQRVGEGYPPVKSADWLIDWEVGFNNIWVIHYTFWILLWLWPWLMHYGRNVELPLTRGESSVVMILWGRPRNGK